MDAGAYLELADWRRRVAGIYAAVRGAHDPREAWDRWRVERDALFRKHPQSPLPLDRRGSFTGLPYFDYEPRARVLAEVREASRERHEVPASSGDTVVFDRIAQATLEMFGHLLTLDIYWLPVYGGGIFLPFRDGTSGDSTYGAGRYLLDTIKGADLGMSDGQLVLDFNFAYNPSCSYDPQWACPLAPPANALAVEVRAGERI